MKALIVDTVSYDRAPYLQYYINACKEMDVPFDLFLWNRDMNGGLQKDKNIFTMNCVSLWWKQAEEDISHAKV